MAKRLVGLVLVACLAFAGLVVVNSGATLGCPAALLTGTLAREGDDLVVDTGDGLNPAVGVKWSLPYHVDEVGDVLVIRDLFGSVRAREGDHIQLGGGVTEGGLWGQCGLFAVDPAAS